MVTINCVSTPPTHLAAFSPKIPLVTPFMEYVAKKNPHQIKHTQTKEFYYSYQSHLYPTPANTNTGWKDIYYVDNNNQTIYVLTVIYSRVLHKGPTKPESHPFKQVPFVWKQTSSLIQCPHVLLQSFPYVPFSQAINYKCMLCYAY